MITLNSDWVEFVLPFINNCPYFINQRMKIIDLKYGKSFLELEIKRKHLQAYGTVHGGVYAGLIDAAGWLAVYTQVEGNINTFTVEMKLNYLASAKSGKFLAHGRCIKLGKNIGLGEATIKNEEGKIMAHGIVTVMLAGTLEYQGMDMSKIPHKFKPCISL